MVPGNRSQTVREQLAAPGLSDMKHAGCNKRKYLESDLVWGPQSIVPAQVAGGY